MSKRKVKQSVGLTALNLFFIVICIVTLIPILYALSVSFSGSNSLLSSDFSFIPKNFTLSNYREVLFGENIAVWFRNTVFLAVVTVTLSLTAAVPAAYCFSRRRFPGRKTILNCLVLLNSFPAILSMFAIYRLLRPMGLVNTRIGLILVYTGTMAVFSLWNTKGYFDTIPAEIEEAARMDGAGEVSVVIRMREGTGGGSGSLLAAGGGAEAVPCGAVAVAEGADDPLVRMQLTQALCALLGLQASAVCVVSASGGGL